MTLEFPSDSMILLLQDPAKMGDFPAPQWGIATVRGISNR